MSLEDVGIEFIMLADSAEVINGKLYMMGGGYDRRFIDNIKAPMQLSMVVSVLVPWSLTNQPHTVKLRIETEDGAVVGPEVQGNLTIGRSSQAIAGQLFRVMTVVNFNLPLPRFGGYKAIATLANGESKATTFYAVNSETTSTTARASG